MAQGIDAFMEDALERAADEAIAEFEDGAQSEDGEVEVDEAAGAEDDEDVLEAADEQSNEADLETEDDEPADDDDTERPVEFSWDGNPDTVPENLKPYFDQVYDTNICIPLAKLRRSVDWSELYVWWPKFVTRLTEPVLPNF